MAQFKAFNDKVEVNGQTVLSVVGGMGAFHNAALRILKENGIDNPARDQWYHQQAWLNAFKQIYESIGESTLYSIGRSIPESAEFPPEINDIYKALEAIDVAYHMNHRLGGAVMFDPGTGKMVEGVGHYRYEKISDRSVKITCNNPYPSEFDRGIIAALAEKFKPKDAVSVKVHLDEKQPTRKNGGDSCTYIVTW
jgi:hypothetical protein